MPNAAPEHETREQMLVRWKAETPLRAQQFNASLPSREEGLEAGVGGFGPSWQDKANRSSDGRF